MRCRAVCQEGFGKAGDGNGQVRIRVRVNVRVMFRVRSGFGFRVGSFGWGLGKVVGMGAVRPQTYFPPISPAPRAPPC